MTLSVFTGITGANAMVAAEYASRGLPVFPCKANKKPMTQSGFKDATTDAVQVERWWRASPFALVGMPTGEVSGFDVLDFDSKHGSIDDMLAELEAEHGRLGTLRVRTPSEGVHLYFQHDARVRIGAGRFRKGVDWRGAGGYVIAPGSRLPDGRAYHVEVDGEPAPWPDTLVGVIAAAQGAQPQLSSVAGGLADLAYQRTTAELVDGTFTEGQWHESMVRIVWSFVQRGFSLDEIMGMAPLFQRAGWSFASTQAEVRKAAQGAFLKQQKDPRGAVIITPGEPGAIQILSAAQLEDRAPPDWQVDGVLPEKAFVNLYGDSATFKSFVALDMALAIACGLPWHGRPVKPGVVLYVLGEGQGSFATRMRAWMAANGVTEPPARFHAILQPVGFGDVPALAALRDAIKASDVDPDVIVIDTLARNFGAGDPDKTKDMSAFVTGVDFIRLEFGASAWVVHHVGKDRTKGARNSNALRAAVDVEIETDRFDTDMAVTLTCKKQKDAEEFHPLTLELHPFEVVSKATGEVVSSLAVCAAGIETLPRPRKEKAVGPEEKHILAVLRDRGSLTTKEVADNVGKDKSNTGKRLRKMAAEGLVKTDGGTYPLYWHPEQYQGDEG
jgi:hypothetical protein